MLSQWNFSFQSWLSSEYTTSQTWLTIRVEHSRDEIWVPWAVSFWYKRAGVAAPWSQPIRAQCLDVSTPKTRLTISTGLVCQNPAVDQEVPWADLHGRNDGHTGADVLLPATAWLPPAPLRDQGAPVSRKYLRVKKYFRNIKYSRNKKIFREI